MCREIIYFCAELLNYWSMTFFGLKLFAKVYGFGVHENKKVENILYVLICLPIAWHAAGNYIYMKYSIFLTYIITIYMFVLIKILGKRQVKISFFLISLYFFIMRLIDLWIVTVVEEVNKMSRYVHIEFINPGSERVIFMIILSIIYYLVYCFCLKINFIKYLIYNRYYCGMICLYSFFGNSCFNGIYHFGYRDKIIGYWTFYLVSAFILVGGFWFYISEIKGKERERLLSMRNDMMESNYKGLRKAYELNRTLQHDYKNHLLAVSELVKDNKNKEALGYINTYIDYTNESQIDVKSGNDIVDIIINSKKSEAKDKLIDFKYEIDYLNDLLIEDIDMCALLANLLDNAIEACEKDVQKESIIYLKIYKRNELFVIQIINSVSKDIIKKQHVFKTDKKDNQLHGWGMKSIEQVINKYGGTKEYYLDDNRIEIFITIPI